MNSTPFAIGLFACLLLVALFAASEAALALTNRVRLRHLLRAGRDDDAQDSSARELSSELSSDTQTFIATVVVAANLPLLGAAACAYLFWTRVWDGVAAWLACAATAGVSVALFQIAPRLLASRPGFLETLWWVKPARLLVAVLRPLVVVLLWLARALLRPFGVVARRAKPKTSDAARDEQAALDESEIRELVDDAERSGALEPEGRELIESIFTFGDTRVHEAMVPRPDMLALPIETSAHDALDLLQTSGFSRLPLYDGTIDHVVGVLHVRHALERLGRGDNDFVLRDLMRAPLFLPETCKLDEALERMRARKTHLAIAIDEFGGTAGLLTVEDVLEELVGEIQDEHDRQEVAPLTILDAQTALADARLHIEDLASEWNVVLPEGDYDTVGGFVIDALGRAPQIGDRVPTNDALLTVHNLRGRRPKTIHITKHNTIKGAESPQER